MYGYYGKNSRFWQGEAVGSRNKMPSFQISAFPLTPHKAVVIIVIRGYLSARLAGGDVAEIWLVSTY
jgi:hypothetical protein